MLVWLILAGVVVVVGWFCYAVGFDMEHTKADEQRDALLAWHRD